MRKGLFSRCFRRTGGRCAASVPGLTYTTSNSIAYRPRELTAEEEAQIARDMDEYFQQVQNDPFWYERSYIDGYYGDLFVKQGGDREDLAAFGRFLLQFGMDLH